jgi:hypothetical protein
MADNHRSVMAIGAPPWLHWSPVRGGKTIMLKNRRFAGVVMARR